MLSFLKQFCKKPECVGAIAPSSKYLAEKMIENIDFKNCSCIVEYGPGTGVFTEKLIARKKENTILIVIESNKEFCDDLKEIYYCNKTVKIINDGAENIKYYLKKYNIDKVNYVVSGLPFAALPEEVSKKILQETKDILNEDGKFITFQYSLVKKKFLKEYFKNIKIKWSFLNLPPAYVLECSERKKIIEN